MIRVATVDHHSLMRAGVEDILRAQPDVEPVGAAADAHAVWPLLYRAQPDVVVLGHVGGGAGSAAALCLRIKRRPLAPRVVLYADAGESPAVLAALAGADGLVHKTASAGELLRAVRTVARGDRALPSIDPRTQAAAAARLDPLDYPILAMRLASTPPAEVAETLGLAPRELADRTAAMVAQLARPAHPLAQAA